MSADVGRLIVKSGDNRAVEVEANIEQGRALLAHDGPAA
jgi:hypothetical protein